METAVILCEENFGKTLGKTAVGLVRRSRRFKIIGVIDSTLPAGDAGVFLDGVHRDIPIFSSIDEVLNSADVKPDFLIIGVATMGGKLPQAFREPVIKSLEAGINVISGLHERLANDSEFQKAAGKGDARIIDIRKEPPLTELKHFRNLSKDLPCLRIPVLGTDAAIGKRTTALELTEEFNVIGVRATFIATGQTGLLQGSDFGAPLDAIKGDFVVGEIESEIVRACETEHPDIIIIEGQGSLSHPAYVAGSRAIISASSPNGVVIQHAPKRKYRSFHEEELHLPMQCLDAELELVRVIAKCPVVGITLNHQGMSREEVQEIMRAYEEKYDVPCTDVLWFGAESIVKEIALRFGLPK